MLGSYLLSPLRFLPPPSPFSLSIQLCFLFSPLEGQRVLPNVLGCVAFCSNMAGCGAIHSQRKLTPQPPPPAANNINKTSPLWLVLYAQIPSPCRGLGWAYTSLVHVVTATVSSHAQLPYWVSKTLLPCSHLPPLPLTFSLLPFLQ